MRIALLCHSLYSDWNHGNAHFLRGVATELIERGHELQIHEPEDSWSYTNLVAEQGAAALNGFFETYPKLFSIRYQPETFDLDLLFEQNDLVLVHEWTDPGLVHQLSRHRHNHPHVRLLFHDTHHRSVTKPDEMACYDLSGFDGVLAFGEAVRTVYLRKGWACRVWVWHEAADARVFFPVAGQSTQGDLVWVGNWGDEERTAELRRFLLEPVKELGLDATVHGVRYPDHALAALADAGIQYRGWLPNYRVPQVFASFRCTVHVPRRPYTQALPGIPTIRMFEALACGIPLVSAPWQDCEQLFTPGHDYLVAADGDQMKMHLRALLNEPALAAELATHGRQTILSRHTCAHRVDELLGFCAEMNVESRVV